ncbi:DUF418 domain-containing protein [Arthrobacter sp. Marseille-P9274]|uniref:DUF418 domain-containing protein n=1 Tax=Arthrobacter sp. Marseille-P9274 TaxID=2866572 RepID=UPI0021C59615|nr:DUF418 domain-containing protein [Arthrobacter sp. Marseille-P9274]
MTGRPLDRIPAASAGAVQRVADLDALRAFALLGILCVNIWYFADPYAITGIPNPDYSSPVDTAVRFMASVLFEAKFYILFSFLFGYSFVLQWASAAASGASEVGRTLRRAAGLVVLGLCHGLFLFYGDILLTYGLLSLVLLGTRWISGKAAVTSASILIGAMGVFVLLTGVIAAAFEPSAPTDAGTLPPAFGLAGPPAEVIAQNLALYPIVGVNVLFLQGPIALGAFYAGLACAKQRVFEHGLSPRLLRRLTAIGLPIGLTAAILQAYLVHYVGGTGTALIAFGISTFTAPALTAGYVALLLLAFRTRRGQRLRALLAPAGKLALSNYLGQSVLMLLVFTGFGLALTNRLPPLAVLGAAALIFVLQLLASYGWVRQFRYGPLEALLRALTYWRRPTLSGATTERSESL